MLFYLFLAILETSAKKKVKKILNKSGQANHDSITGLIFQDNHTLISCSAGDGYVYLNFIAIIYFKVL